MLVARCSISPWQTTLLNALWCNRQRAKMFHYGTRSFLLGCLFAIEYHGMENELCVCWYCFVILCQFFDVQYIYWNTSKTQHQLPFISFKRQLSLGCLCFDRSHHKLTYSASILVFIVTLDSMALLLGMNLVTETFLKEQIPTGKGQKSKKSWIADLSINMRANPRCRTKYMMHIWCFFVFPD